jgi:8-oxo-dGTP pyrophosphatase MutT (NUDIX family)
LITDPIFEQVYNHNLLRKLENRFGPFTQQHVELAGSTGVLAEMIHKIKDRGRRGEVVMVVPNEQGRIWLHTKSFYPEGVFRLMSGGLDAGEKPHRAMQRELAEETGLKTKIDRCLAVITYTLAADELTLPFVSYVFLTNPAVGLPKLMDSKEAITQFQAVAVAELPAVARQLRSLKGEFADWGIFRAVAHQVAWQQLQIG